MRKRILVVLACMMTFGWTCMTAVAAEKSASATKVMDANEKAEKKAEKKEKKEKKHEGKHKGHKVEDANSTGKKA